MIFGRSKTRASNRRLVTGWVREDKGEGAAGREQGEGCEGREDRDVKKRGREDR